MKRVAITLAALACLSPIPAQAAEQMLFISPSGKPWLAEAGKPYPLVDWFRATDTSKDGRIDPAEMRAEADAFFTELDRDKDGAITSMEVRIYEVYIVPEILSVGALNDLPLVLQPGFHRAQLDPMQIAPNTQSSLPQRQRLKTNQGAVQFSLFREPQPVRAADRNLDYRVTRPEFAAHADRHFKALDGDGDGFLNLMELPETAAERAVGGKRRRTP